MSGPEFTRDEQWALQNLADDVERGEYASDRIVLHRGIGAYTVEHAMLHAQAVLKAAERQDIESTQGGWA